LDFLDSVDDNRRKVNLTKLNVQNIELLNNEDFNTLVTDVLYRNERVYNVLSKKKPRISDSVTYKLDGEFYRMVNNESFKYFLQSFFKDDEEVPEISEIHCFEYNKSYRFKIENRFVELLESKMDKFEERNLTLTEYVFKNNRNNYTRNKNYSDDDLFFSSKEIISKLPTFRPFQMNKLGSQMRMRLGMQRQTSNVRFLQRNISNKRLSLMMATFGGMMYWYKNQ
jgi:hypothetical protein